MKRLFDPYFICYLSLWSIVHHLRQCNHIIPPINSYLTDFLAVPAIAHLTITIIRNYVVKDQHYCYPGWYITVLVCYLSIVFEWLMPLYSPRYTGDVWDIAAYACGGLFYYFVHARFCIPEKAKN